MCHTTGMPIGMHGLHMVTAASPPLQSMMAEPVAKGTSCACSNTYEELHAHLLAVRFLLLPSGIDAGALSRCTAKLSGVPFSFL